MRIFGRRRMWTTGEYVLDTQYLSSDESDESHSSVTFALLLCRRVDIFRRWKWPGKNSFKPNKNRWIKIARLKELTVRIRCGRSLEQMRAVLDCMHRMCHSCNRCVSVGDKCRISFTFGIDREFICGISTLSSCTFQPISVSLVRCTRLFGGRRPPFQ